LLQSPRIPTIWLLTVPGTVICLAVASCGSGAHTFDPARTASCLRSTGLAATWHRVRQPLDPTRAVLLVTLPDGSFVGIAFAHDREGAKRIAQQHGAAVEVRSNAVVETSSGTLDVRSRHSIDACLS
jgi:hypothetical protein